MSSVKVFPSAAAPAAAASAPSAAAGTGPTEEQLERMRRNKELAARSAISHMLQIRHLFVIPQSLDF